MATYNHEDYIVQALDSILMQKTKYTYEVLVGEDCSTDNTRQILQVYEKEHPGKFQIFYREHNMRNDRISNGLDLKLRCKGKYIIALEGDDFWTDPYKLEKQIRFLEDNPEYIAVSHNCMVVDHDSSPKNEHYPECYDEEYTFCHLFYDILPGQLATVMYRNTWKEDALLKKKITPGDRVVYFWLLCHGKVHCIQEVMSAYRHVTDRGSSFSATYRYNYTDNEYHYRSLMEYAAEINHAEALLWAEDLYFRHQLYAFRRKACTFSDVYKGLSRLKHKRRAVVRYIRYKVNKDLFKKTAYGGNRT